MVRAAVARAFGAPLQIEDITVIGPSAGEVLIDVKACAICHSDIMYIDGAWGGELPTVYGHEAAGVVAAVGDGVTHVAVGDHVAVSLIRSCGACHFCQQELHVACCGTFPLDQRDPLVGSGGEVLGHGLATGAFAEQAVVDGSQVVAIPSTIPWPSAALLGCGVITGVGAVLNTASVPPGSHVVVVGCGGVGINALQGAALAGAASVIALDIDPDKRQGALQFGATSAVDPTAVDAVEQVRALTNGRGADYVFVTVGAKPAIESSFGYLAAGGAAVIVGMTANGVTVDVDSTTMASRNQRMLGSKMGSGRVSVDIPHLVALYQQGQLQLDELVSQTFPLEQINEAIAEVKAGTARRNVIVFDSPASGEE